MVLSILGELMIQVEENISLLKCLAVEDCLTVLSYVELCYQLRSRVDFKTVCNGLGETLSGMGGLWPWRWRGAAIRVAIDRS